MSNGHKSDREAVKALKKQRAMAFVGIAADPDPTAARRHDELFAEILWAELHGAPQTDDAAPKEDRPS